MAAAWPTTPTRAATSRPRSPRSCTARPTASRAIIARDHGGPFDEYAHEPRAVPPGHGEAPRRGLRDPDRRRARPTCSTRPAQSGTRRSSSAEQHGYRNAQVTVLAPTGTIAFMMDCDTTGIEPDIALVKYKQLAGGGMLKIVNQTVPAALRKLGYDAGRRSRRSSPTSTSTRRSRARRGLKPEHLPVFDCAFKPVNGERSIHYMGHVRMMAAVQPFLSGAISKTVNMPEAATAEDIERRLPRGLEARPQGDRDLPRRLASAASRCQHRQEEGRRAPTPIDRGRRRAAQRQLAGAQAEASKPHRRRLPAERDGGHPQVRHPGPRGLHHRRPLPRRPARRDLHHDGQGRLDDRRA